LLVTQPLFLTDYSDPFDLKRQNEEAAAAAAAKASQLESRPSVVQSEDEYSVPYEIKHQLNGKF